LYIHDVLHNDWLKLSGGLSAVDKSAQNSLALENGTTPVADKIVHEHITEHGTDLACNVL
jgi:hypothetical protein